MEPNPYEPPQSDKPQTRGKLVKRRIGFGVILLLTPLAVGIAIACSCKAAYYVADMPFNSAILAGYAVAFIPPVVVLVAMLWWAVEALIRGD